VEVGINRPGLMAGFAAMVRPDVVVVTSIGSEHNRYLGSLEVTRHEKAEMVRALPADGLVILNGDDPNVRWMATQTNARVVTFGFGEQNQVRAVDLGLDWPHGRAFELRAGGQVRRLRVRHLGRHQVYSFLAAAAVTLAEGLDLDGVLPSLEALEPLAGRLTVTPLPNGAFLLRDDFKSALETIEVALDTLAEVPARRIVVLGAVTEAPGPQRPIYRRLGERVAEIAARAIFVGESYERYAAGALSAGLPRQALTRVETASEAAAALQRLLEPGDVVLIKGRDSQRLERVALRLQGRTVRCDIRTCRVRWSSCDRCPMLARDWAGLPAVT
jgi:UDP-N-acetylmuramyl pentapeptide synthase